jgi:hypothetical protein
MDVRKIDHRQLAKRIGVLRIRDCRDKVYRESVILHHLSIVKRKKCLVAESVLMTGAFDAT